MKKLLFIIVLMISFLSFSQNEYLENFKQKEVVFPGCEDNSDQKGCFDIRLQDFIANTISDDDLAYIIQNKKKDTIRINSSLYFDKNGMIDKKDSKIGFFYDKNQKSFVSLVDNFPKVKPILDEEGRGVNTNKRSILTFVLQGETLKPINNYIPDEVPFSVIENVPVYKGCDAKTLDNKALKKCMSKRIGDLISKKFNIRKASKGMPSGTVKIYAAFKVDKTGEVREIKVRAPNKRLEKETRRVLKLIPKLDKPGYQRGKPVIVPYSLPIVFRVK